MAKKMLGVLVTSIQHGEHLYPLFRAARRKNIALAVHFQGDGVRLCLDKRSREVLDQIQFSICRHSAEALGIADQVLSRYPHLLTSDRSTPAAIGACAKHVVL